jgi:hypothetical protein
VRLAGSRHWEGYERYALINAEPAALAHAPMSVGLAATSPTTHSTRSWAARTRRYLPSANTGPEAPDCPLCCRLHNTAEAGDHGGLMAVEMLDQVRGSAVLALHLKDFGDHISRTHFGAMNDQSITDFRMHNSHLPLAG